MTRGWLYYLMVPLLGLAALFQSTIATRLVVRGVKPDLVLVLLLIGVMLYGPKAAVVWAFVGGIFLDIFSGGPMGASSLALMAAVLVTGLSYRTLSRYHLLVPIGVSIVGTVTYGAVYLAILFVLDGLAGAEWLRLPQYNAPFWLTMQTVVGPAVLYNTTVILLTVPFLNRVPETSEAETAFS
ncbi:MAG: rod shape-determining protein MreD [Caldilineaceae bacterium]|nr:rod shape-determining protein MreD [Caldilineaceae bacterium]MCB9138627.1 rod shape-determining protein MreD [Caldilineaceae bacterium]